MKVKRPSSFSASMHRTTCSNSERGSEFQLDRSIMQLDDENCLLWLDIGWQSHENLHMGLVLPPFVAAAVRAELIGHVYLIPHLVCTCYLPILRACSGS